MRRRHAPGVRPLSHQRLRRGGGHIAIALGVVLAAYAQAQTPDSRAVGGADVVAVRHTQLPASVAQGSLVIGSTHMAAIVEYAGRKVRVAPSGRFVFGVGRDAAGPLLVRSSSRRRCDRTRIAVTSAIGRSNASRGAAENRESARRHRQAH